MVYLQNRVQMNASILDSLILAPRADPGSKFEDNPRNRKHNHCDEPKQTQSPIESKFFIH